uniref:Si:ch211-194c3.5 n=1 Tax=Cyprinus carpio TaxID=7962 RepID=A0A8C1RVP1_CYPCA
MQDCIVSEPCSVNVMQCHSCSCSRLRQVQALLRDDVNTAPDGILCSLGIDSRYNEGCSELASYLFCGMYKHNHFDMEQIPEDFPEEVLDDVIILIKAECVHLYCNPVNYGYLLPYVSHWRNLQLHCLTETEYEDEEVAEEFKISSFVSMVQDCRCIGIPYSSHGHVQKFDMFMLEKWPIIQAFALEGIGAGVFFTMKYKLTDVSQRLWQVYSRLDPASLDSLLNEVNHLHRLLVKRPFTENNMLDMIPCVMLNLIFCVFQPFRTYYSHGLISSNITDKSKSRQPIVLFGSHSTKEDLENYCFTFPSEGHQVRNTGPGGGVAKHMVRLMQCVAPKGPLACARTYFFGSTHVPYLGKSAQISSKLLSHIYSAVVQSVLAGIKCFSINSSASKVRITPKGSKAVFSIQAVNNEGTIIPLSDEDSRFMVKTASMMVHDIPDLHCGGNLGSVVFSESFLESSVYIQQRGKNLCFTVLTSSVPRYVCWLEEDGTCLGIPLTVRDSAYMFSNSLLSTPEEGKLVFFSEGILFVHPHHGSITLSMSHINTIKLYDGASLSDVSMLFIKYQTSLLPHLPFPLHSADLSLAIALLPRTKSYKSFYSQVLTHTHTHTHTYIFMLEETDHKENLCDFLMEVNQNSASFCAYCMCCRYTDVMNVIQAITAHPDPQVHSQVTVGAVSACVNPLTSFIKHRQELLFPKLLEQCSQGVVSNVIFTGLTTEQKHPLLKYMQQLIRAANPSTAFISAEKWVVRRTEDIRLILNDSSFSQSHMINARYLLYPGWWEGRFVSGSGSLSMSQLCIEFSRPLEKALFLQRCKALKSSLKPSSFTGNIYHISGKVLFSDNDRQMVVNCNSISGNVTIAPDQGTHHGPRTTNNCYLMFHGVGLTQEGLKDWLRHCAKQKVAKKIKKNKRTLTPQEIRYIHVKRHLDPLPPGYFYNGHHFVSFFGEKQNFHPLMDQFIDEYVQEANKEIEHFNREVDLQPHVDLFDP